MKNQRLDLATAKISQRAKCLGARLIGALAIATGVGGTLALSSLASAQTTDTIKTVDDNDVQKNRWTETQAIVDAIKKENPPDTLKLKVKLGTVQMITNTGNAPSIGLNGILPAVAVEGVVNIFDNFGLEAREVYVQNLLPTTGSRNGSSDYMSWTDVGPRYVLYLDSTRLDNNIIFKALYHQNYNNFLPDSGNETVIWSNYYSGVSLGFERNIPITTKLGIMGSLDILQILQSSSPSLSPATLTKSTITNSGYGFEVQAEIYYKTQWGTTPLRLGFGYWQQGNQTPLDGATQLQTGKNSYFQMSRALFATTTFLF